MSTGMFELMVIGHVHIIDLILIVHKYTFKKAKLTVKSFLLIRMDEQGESCYIKFQ